MNVSVPEPCFDSAFHHKWRLALIDGVRDHGASFLRQPVKDALKKFLAHPTSLPYEESKVKNFVINSMIVTEEDVLEEFAGFVAQVRLRFFDGLQDGRKRGGSGDAASASSRGVERGAVGGRDPSAPKAFALENLDAALPGASGNAAPVCRSCRAPLEDRRPFDVIVVYVPPKVGVSGFRDLLVPFLESLDTVKIRPVASRDGTLSFLVSLTCAEDVIRLVNAESKLASVHAPMRVLLPARTRKNLPNALTLEASEGFTFTERTKERLLDFLRVHWSISLAASSFFPAMNGATLVLGGAEDVKIIKKLKRLKLEGQEFAITVKDCN